MRQLFTICLLIIASQVFSQNNAINSLQQRLVQAKGTEKIPELNNLAKTYRNVDPNKSVAVGRKALKYINNDDISKVFSLINIGILYSEAGMGKESIPYLLFDSTKKDEHYINRAVFMFDSLNIDEGEIASLNSLATLLIRKHEFAKLPNIINKITILLTKEKDSYVAMNSYRLLSDYYANKGDYKKSNGYLKKWVTVHDSILNKKNRYALDEFQVIYKTEKKDQEKKTQEAAINDKDLKLRYSLAGAGGILAVLILIATLYWGKNEANKQLVSQSLNVVGKTQYENDKMNHPTNHQTIDKELKKHIINALDKQIETKVYLKSGLAIKELAEKCETNRSYLSQMIHEKYQMNFNNFINK